MRISFRILSHAAFAILLLAGRTAANAQEIENRQVVVRAEAEELPTATVLRLTCRMVASLP